MSKYNDYPEVTKGSGRGFGRFLILFVLAVMLAFLVAAWSGRNTAVVTEPATDTAAPVTTPDPSTAVVMNVQQAAPVMSVNVEQAAPPPTTDMLLYYETQRAYQRGDDAYRAANEAYAYADDLSYRVRALETAVAQPAPDLSPTLVAFQATADQHQRQLSALTGGVVVALLAVVVFGAGLGWLTMRPPAPAPRLTIAHPAQLRAEPAEPLVVPQVELIRTVSEPFRNRSEEPPELQTELPKLDPTRPPTARERATLRGLHSKHRGSISAVCYEAYGQKNKRIWAYVKDAVTAG